MTILGVAPAAVNPFPSVRDTLLRPNQISNVSMHHARVIASRTSSLSASQQQVLFVPHRASTAFPRRVAAVAELMPAQARHVVATHVQLHKTATLAATRIFLVGRKLLERCVFMRSAVMGKRHVLCAGKRGMGSVTGVHRDKEHFGHAKNSLGPIPTLSKLMSAPHSRRGLNSCNGKKKY